MNTDHSSADICLEPAAMLSRPPAEAEARSRRLDARLQEILDESWNEFEQEYLLRPAPPVRQGGQQPPHAH